MLTNMKQIKIVVELLIIKTICIIPFLIIRILAFTYRYKLMGVHNETAARSAHLKEAYIVAAFHEQMIGDLMAHYGKPYCLLVSKSKDGEIATTLIRWLKFIPVRGSSSRGGASAMKEILEFLSQGMSTALTIDGPRGPRRKCKPGVIALANKSGAAIVPVVSVAEKEWVFSKSWDQFKLPKPFTRIILRYGSPIAVGPGKDLSSETLSFLQAQVESAMLKEEEIAKECLQAWINGTDATTLPGQL